MPVFDACVLVVEDQAVNRQLAVAMLQAFGCRVEVAHDGRSGAVAALGGAYDLVLMDCQMPEMDGFEATQAIRRHEAATGARRLPIAAVTANAVIGDRERCFSAGMDDYLSKPFTRAQLGELLLRWLPQAIAPDAGPLPAATTPVVAREEASQSHQEAPQASAINWATLDAIHDMGGSELLHDMVALFASDSPPLLTALCTALETGNSAAVARAAHALKSISLNLGAVELGEICRHIEAQAREGREILAGLGAEAERLHGAALAALQLRINMKKVKS
jgi:CheY-like chemotaxis protein